MRKSLVFILIAALIMCMIPAAAFAQDAGTTPAVSYSQPRGTYGKPLPAAVKSPATGWTVSYKGTTNGGAAFEGAEVPTDAGIYFYTAKHTGADGRGNVVKGAFMISKAELDIPQFPRDIQPGMTLGNIAPSVSKAIFTWNEPNSADTVIAKDTRYAWTLTPDDPNNYEMFIGEVEPYKSGSGTSSGSNFGLSPAWVYLSGGASVSDAWLDARAVLYAAADLYKYQADEHAEAYRIAAKAYDDIMAAVDAGGTKEHEVLETEIEKIKDAAVTEILALPTLEEENARIAAGVENTTIKLSSQIERVSSGKNAIKLKWTKSKGFKVDYYEVYRSTKKNSGYGTKPYFTTKSGTKTWYTNSKGLKKGTRYYYYVRGVRIIDGEKAYTDESNKAYRTIK